MILFNQHDFNAYCRNNVRTNVDIVQAWAISRSDHNRLMSVTMPPTEALNAAMLVGAQRDDYHKAYARLLQYLRNHLDKLAVGGAMFLVTLCRPSGDVWCWLEPNTLPQPVRSQDKDFGVG